MSGHWFISVTLELGTALNGNTADEVLCTEILRYAYFLYYIVLGLCKIVSTFQTTYNKANVW